MSWSKAVLKYIVSALLLLTAAPSIAGVQVQFHSFNGSVLIGRYPHTFISLNGTLDGSGEVIDKNFGFSAKDITPAMLSGPVKHKIVIEPVKYVKSTNVHFSMKISDAQYHRIIAEVNAWQSAPGKYYDLDKRNCIHFVGEIAKILGLRVEYPPKMMRKPKKWLNHITLLNPSLGARIIS